MQNEIIVRNLIASDYIELKDSMIKAYSQMQNSYWSSAQIEKLIKIFPEGQIVVLVN